MAKNANLHAAKKAKNDEFYTRYEDIQAELIHYQKHFKGKVVYCNCDDPAESNFVKFFCDVFEDWGLKELIATHYDPDEEVFTYHISITEDSNGDGDITPEDMVRTDLPCNGDFRSAACIELLKRADIVVTNPPFSLFREYVAQLIEYDKKFVIIGNVNAVTNKDFFPLIKENKVWIGPSIHAGDRMFYVPDSYPLEGATCGIDEETGRRFIRIKGVRWYTNLDHSKRHQPIELRGNKYYGNEDKYPKYDNYDAINVDKVVDIPEDYKGIMGVPITFLDKYCPEQFEIIWQASGNSYNNAPKEVLEALKFDPTIKYGGGLGTGVVKGKAKYSRILIRAKTIMLSRETTTLRDNSKEQIYEAIESKNRKITAIAETLSENILFEPQERVLQIYETLIETHEELNELYEKIDFGKGCSDGNTNEQVEQQNCEIVDSWSENDWCWNLEFCNDDVIAKSLVDEASSANLFNWQIGYKRTLSLIDRRIDRLNNSIKKYYESALQAYQQSDYLACANVLFSAADGVLYSYWYPHLKTYIEENKSTIRIKNLLYIGNKKYSKNRFVKDIWESFYQVYLRFYKTRKGFPDKYAYSMNRNYLVHGMSKRDWTINDCNKLLVFNLSLLDLTWLIIFNELPID